MTATPAPEPAPEPDAPQPPGDPASTDDEHTDDESANSEAAKYRRRLRETETARDTLASRVERLQHAEVARQVADRLAQPQDLFAFGVTLKDVLGEDGEVDDGLVETALLGLLDSRPGLAKVTPRPNGPSSAGAGFRPSRAAAAPSWSDVLRRS